MADDTKSYSLELTLEELNAVRYALSLTIISDRRRTDTPTELDRRVNNVIDHAVDASAKVSALANTTELKNDHLHRGYRTINEGDQR